MRRIGCLEQLLGECKTFLVISCELLVISGRFLGNCEFLVDLGACLELYIKTVSPNNNRRAFP